MRTIFLLLVGILFSNLGFSQNSSAYSYKFKIAGAEDTTIYLANYFGNKLYYFDTAQSDNNGVVIFEGDSLHYGVYAVVTPGSKYFEIICNEPTIEIHTSTSDFTGAMKIVNSKENQIFMDYVNHLRDRRQDVNKLVEEEKTLDKEKDKKKLEKIQSKKRSIDKAVKKYQNDLVDKYKETLVSKVLRMSIDVEIPEEIKGDSLKPYYYFRKHYWDNIDLKDDRLVRSPIFHRKLQYFFDKMVPKQPDTTLAVIHPLIATLNDRSDMFKYIVHHITYKYETSKIMGMDAVFAGMIRYYERDQITGKTRAFWLKKDKVDEIVDRMLALGRIRIGGPAPRLILLDTTEKNWVDLYEVQADWKILIFWSPDCGHCKKELPKYKQIYNKFKPHKVEVVAVGTELENVKWRKVIQDLELDWVNISDNPEVNEKAQKYIVEDRLTTLESLNFRSTYDVYSTPKVFLLDKANNIVMKQVDAYQVEKWLNRKLGLTEMLLKPDEKKSEGKKEENDSGKS